MNLQRREEILALIADQNGTHAMDDYRAALIDAMDWIYQLEVKAAERVIARGAAVKPHTFAEIVNQVRDIANQYAGTEQLRERIAYALAPHFERNGGPMPDYTGEGSAWVPPKVEASSVVLPEITGPEIYLLLVKAHNGDQSLPDVLEEFHTILAGVINAWFRKHARAIPADRVPGDGERRICSEELMYLRSLERYARKHGPESIQDVIGCLDHLRANQGGAAT